MSFFKETPEDRQRDLDEQARDAEERRGWPNARLSALSNEQLIMTGLIVLLSAQTRDCFDLPLVEELEERINPEEPPKP